MFKGSTVRQSGLGQSSIFFQARAACQVLSMGSTDVHRRRPWPPHPFSKGSTSENFASSLSVASSKGTREESMQPERKMRDVKAREILFWAPNLVTYFRLLLLCVGLALAPSKVILSFSALVLSLSLDALDGWLARTLSQASRFGAFLDVAADNLSRAAILTAALSGPWPAVLITLEALTFVCTNAVSLLPEAAAGTWKDNYFLDAPGWAKAVMANGFRTPLGCLAMTGLFGLPLWMFARKYLPGSIFSSIIVGIVVASGRLVTASVELWAIYAYLRKLLQEDCKERVASSQA